MENNFIDLYNRTYKNCVFYMSEGNEKKLLNEIGVLRGIVYCMESVIGENLVHFVIDYSGFISMIKEQEKLRN